MADGSEEVTVRLTVPLFETRMEGDGGGALMGRLEIAPGVVIALLNVAERERVRKGYGGANRTPTYRLELHDVQLSLRSRESFVAHAAAEAKVRRTMALLCCAVRVAPAWYGISADVHDGTCWRRRATVMTTGGGGSRYNLVPHERLQTWGSLLRNWPATEPNEVATALDFFLDSVADRNAHPHKSLMSAAVSLETLIGGGLRGEQRYRLSQRIGVLLAPGVIGQEIAARFRKWYDERSGLMHTGKRPAKSTLQLMQQSLMRAIPSMAVLTDTVGSYAAAIEVLDQAAWKRAEELEMLFGEPAGWWSAVPAKTLTA